MRPALAQLYVRDGLFEFDPRQHDFGSKEFLGSKINGSGFQEVEDALDLLANSPMTARHISRKLATYFIGSEPSEQLLDQMVTCWRQNQGEIGSVLDVLLGSHEYKSAVGTSFKDPMHYVLSAVRLSYGGQIIENTDPILGWLNRLGEGLYSRQTPDGYPIDSKSWINPRQLEIRFEIAKAIGSGSAALVRPSQSAGGDDGGAPPLRRLASKAGIAATLSPATATALAKANSQAQWNMLFLSSPEFMRR